MAKVQAPKMQALMMAMSAKPTKKVTKAVAKKKKTVVKKATSHSPSRGIINNM